MLEHFQKYLQDRVHIQQKYIPFYLKWVADCWSFLHQSLEKPISQDQKRDFMKYLAGSHEDWQVKQADYAIRLYGFFLSQEYKNKHSGEKVTQGKAEWAKIEEDTRKALRLRHRSLSTEKTYLIWLRQFTSFIGEKSPQNIGSRDLQDFLIHLALERRVAAATQNQAFNALLFMLRHALGIDTIDGIDAVRAKYKRRLPVVLTQKEVETIFDLLESAGQAGRL